MLLEGVTLLIAIEKLDWRTPKGFRVDEIVLGIKEIELSGSTDGAKKTKKREPDDRPENKIRIPHTPVKAG
jgi:hypothetical protein